MAFPGDDLFINMGRLAHVLPQEEVVHGSFLQFKSKSLATSKLFSQQDVVLEYSSNLILSDQSQ